MADRLEQLEQRLDEERLDFYARLKAANEHIQEEVDPNKVTVWYDPDLDVLSVRFAPSSGTESVATGSLIARVDTVTLKLVGFEILDFRALIAGHFPDDMRLANILRPYAERLMQIQEPTRLTDEVLSDDVAGMMRELVAV
jgi:hypothetical protein